MQNEPLPSWLNGGEEALAMAIEDGLLPAAQHTLGHIAQAWEDAMLETINDDARVKSFTWLTICPQCLFGEVDGRMKYEPGRAAIAKTTGSAS